MKTEDYIRLENQYGAKKLPAAGCRPEPGRRHLGLGR